MNIESLGEATYNQVYKAFSQAFSDYEVQLNKDELLTMLNRRGFDPDLSFAAFKDNVIVSFILNGIGEFKGKKTAYDTGTGTIKAFQKKGLATKIFNHSIPFLKKAGVEQYLLEVLQHNTGAVKLYQQQSFEISREFIYIVKPVNQVDLFPKVNSDKVSVEKTHLSNVIPLCVFHDFVPSWQNSFSAIERKEKDFAIYIAKKDKEVLGYGIIELKSGDITQIAVDPKHRRKGIGTELLRTMLTVNKAKSIKLVNIETTCESMIKFCEKHGLRECGKQFEMIKQL